MTKYQALRNITDLFNSNILATTLDFALAKYELNLLGVSNFQINKHLGINQTSIVHSRTPTLNKRSSNFNLQQAKVRLPKPTVIDKPNESNRLYLAGRAKLDVQYSRPPTEEEILAKRFN